MSNLEFTCVAEKGLHLYLLNKDPLTFSAAKILLKAAGTVLDEAQQNAYDYLQRQLASYDVLYTEPLM